MSIMTTGEALSIVNQFGNDNNAESFLDCIEKMDIAFKNGELFGKQRIAYMITINELQEFFAPV